MLKGSEDEILDLIPLHEFLLYREGEALLWKAFQRLLIWGSALAVVEKYVGLLAKSRRFMMSACSGLLRRSGLGKKSKSVLPEKTY